MKNRFLVAFCAALAALPACAQQDTVPQNTPTPSSASFSHPSVYFSKADLEQLKGNLDKEPWKSGFAALEVDYHSSLDYKMQGPFATVSRNPDSNLGAWRNDMQAIFNLSRMWYFTGQEAYAQKAHDILLAWATTQTKFAGNESNLDLGDYAYRFVGGADILRGTWPGWTQTDTDTVKSFFTKVYWLGAYADKDSLGPANKGGLTLAVGAAIAIFNDDRQKMDHILHLFRTGAPAGLSNTLPTGEIGESGRDQGHAYGQLLSLVLVAEIFWKQGIDLYSERNNRILAAGEYHARYNLGIETPFVPFGTTDWSYMANNSATWPHGRMALNLLHGAYVLRKGLNAPYIERRRKELYVDMDNFCFEKSTDNSKATPLTPFVVPQTASITAGLTDLDIGDVKPAGNSSYSQGVWMVQGAGKDIWTHDNDSFHFVFKPVTGDCAIIAKVDSVQNTSNSAKAGVMIRESLNAHSTKAWIAITPSKTAQFFMSGWTDVFGGSNWEKTPVPFPNNPTG